MAAISVAHPLQNDNAGASLVVMLGVAAIGYWFWRLRGPERDSFLGIGGAGAADPKPLSGPFTLRPAAGPIPVYKPDDPRNPGGGPPFPNPGRLF
jgi:hypothetical protein